MTAARLLYVVLALSMVPACLALWWPDAASICVAFNFVLLIIVIVDLWRTQPKKFLTGTRDVSERLSIGRDNQVLLYVFNQGNTTLTCRLKDDFPRALDTNVTEFRFEIAPGAKVTLSYSLTPRRRGSYQFGSVNIRYLSRFGLFWRSATIKADMPVKVFSDLKALRDLSVKLSHSSELGDLHQRRRGQGTDFASLKEYTVGDDSRSIDWKATARRDRPVVRTYEVEREQVLLVLIDAGRMMVSDLEGLSRFDHALNAGLSLALAGLSRNDQVGFGIFADRPLAFLPARRGKGQLTRILEATFDTRPQMVEPDYMGVLSYFASAQKGRSLMVVITDLTDPTGSQMLLAGLASLSPKHLPFCVTLKDRQVDQIAADRSLSIDNIYRRAVATDLQAQRELALSVLQRRGCLVLDSPPQELSTQLVDRYLAIKAQGRL